MGDLERLESMLRAGHACVFIPTHEEEYALRLVKEAAMGLGYGVKVWTAVRGLCEGLVGGAPSVPQTEHPAAGLFRFGQLDAPTICVACDLIGHLGDERTLRAAREVIQVFEERGAAPDSGPPGRLVIIDHHTTLPAALGAAAVKLEISLPDEQEIEAISLGVLRRMHRQKPIRLDISRKAMEAIYRNLRGLTRRQVERLIMEAVADDRLLTSSDLDSILARKRQLVAGDGLLEFVQAPTDMAEIGGLGRLKTWLRNREAALSDKAREFGLSPPRGVLMLGVQGAGKSLCTKAIATAWRRPLLRLDPSVLYDRYIGESERRLRDALRSAEMMAPIVLWIDEIEKGFASAASHSIDGGLSQRMFGTLLTWMQEHAAPVFLAATANDIEALPPELLRKGRFDEIFFVDLPGEASRRMIFEIHLKKRGRDAATFDTGALAKASEGYSGAEIEQGVIAALHEAFATKSDVTTESVRRAIEGSPPLSVTMAEKIADLREWAKGRCMPAE